MLAKCEFKTQRAVNDYNNENMYGWNDKQQSAVHSALFPISAMKLQRDGTCDYPHDQVMSILSTAIGEEVIFVDGDVFTLDMLLEGNSGQLYMSSSIDILPDLKSGDSYC